MTTPGLKPVVAFVALVAVAQVLFEDAVMFVATTGGGPSWLTASPYVVVGIPLVLSLSLLLVLVGVAVLEADTL